MAQIQLLAIIILYLTYPLSGAYWLHTCDLSGDTCAQLLKGIEKAVLEDDGNLYRMRRAFFYSPTAAPVLLKVVYNVSFSDNITNIISCGRRSNLTVELMPRNITYGWTSSGVYTVFHPTVLNMLQAQIPFAALRIVHKTLDQRSPEADAFLWDGSYDLPTLYLNMHITALPCLPSQDLFESVLVDFNTLLKLYAARQEALNFGPTNDFIGFTLPSTSVTASEIPIGSDVVMVNLYSSIMWILYTTSIIAFLVWYYDRKPHNHDDNKRKKEQRKRIHKWIGKNKSLVAGMVTTAVTTIVIETCARIANCSVWALNTDNSSGVFLAVWMQQSYLTFLGLWLTIFCHIAGCCIKIRYHKKDTSEFLLSHIHIILPLYLTAYGLLYSLLPAVILVLAYPTQMIAIATFVLAYLFATTIFSAVLINFYSAPNSTNLKGIKQEHNIQQQSQSVNQQSQQNSCHEEQPQSRQKQLIKTILFFAMLFIPFWLIILYLHCIAIVFLYSLLVGTGSAINTGPLFIISLLPSALVSGVAWIAQRVALVETKSTDKTSQKKDQALKLDVHQVMKNFSSKKKERVTIIE